MGQLVAEHLGVDVVVPNMEFLDDCGTIHAVVLTHAHLDHSGWLPVLLQRSANSRIQPGQPGWLEPITRPEPSVKRAIISDIHSNLEALAEVDASVLVGQRRSCRLV